MAAKTLAELRKARGNFEDLSKKIEAQNTKGGGKKDDERFWQCAVDKAGNGQATIRFLTAPQGEEDAWVRLFSHGFQGPTGKWYIENSLTTLSKPGAYVKDPVAELNNELYASKIEANIAIAKKQKRKLNYYANVLIISDPANPENEGKVKIFRFGKKIFDKIQAALEPEFEDDPKFNPFDFWGGANFRLKITKVEGFANFDKSSFAQCTPVSDDDNEIQKIWDQCHSLQALIAPDQFKSYEELEKRLQFVLATGGASKTAEQTTLDEDDEAFLRQQSKQSASRSRQAAPADQEDPPFEPDTKPASTSRKPAAATVADDEDDDMAYFKNLAAS